MINEYAERIIERATLSKLSLATAESCTGGQLAAALTAVPGASQAFVGGIIAYSNEVKRKLLSLTTADLNNHGAVSREVAMKMAQGARKLFAADYAVSTTGVAGPGGGTASKPVGLVYVAWATPQALKVEELRLSGDRAAIQAATVEAGLRRLLELLKRA